MKAKSRAEWDVSIKSEELCILASWFLSPTSKNSILDELRVWRLAVIQEVIHPLRRYDRWYNWGSHWKNIAPFLRYSEMLVENRRPEPIPPLFGTSLGWPRRNFTEIFGIRKLESLSYCDLYVYSRSGTTTIPAYTGGHTNGQTDGRTHDDNILLYNIASHGRNQVQS